MENQYATKRTVFFMSHDLHVSVINMYALYTEQQRVLWKYWPWLFNGGQHNINTSPRE